MNTPILNRDGNQNPDGEWYMIEAKGEHFNAAANVVQVVDDIAIKSMADNFNADAKAGTLSHGHMMLVDRDHLKDQMDQETRAYGWLLECQARPDGLYGRIKWTATGKAAVEGGDYKFFSTEYAPKDLQPL